MAARFLMIALDGADGVLLDRWSADGTLPHLAALRRRGRAHRLATPKGSTDDALWASFAYAIGPGEHGRYHYRQRLRSGEMGMAHTDEADRPTFWDRLSARGLRIAVFDVPKCRLPLPINGIHLVDWLVHGRYSAEPRSYPEPLAAEVVARFGAAPPSRCGYERPALSDAELVDIGTNLRLGVDMKRAAALHYLAADSWDLFIVGFKEAHCAGHMLWDRNGALPGVEESREALLREPLRVIFQDLDASVGQLVAAAGPDAAVAVFSTTDMESNATLGHLMPEIVNRLNRELGETRFGRLARRIRRRLSRARVRRRCELLPYNENSTALRVNPSGGIFGRHRDHRRETARMLAKIESLLRELTDPDTGRPVVAAIDRPSAEHRGSRSADLPDLLIRYEAGTFPRAVVSPRLGRIEAPRPPARPGNHTSGGFVVLAGDADADVVAMEDFGSLATKVLGVGI